MHRRLNKSAFLVAYDMVAFPSASFRLLQRAVSSSVDSGVVNGRIQREGSRKFRVGGPRQLSRPKVAGDGRIRRNNGQRLKERNSPLPKPSILHESKHMLAVNKPPGWHSIPRDRQISGDKSSFDGDVEEGPFRTTEQRFTWEDHHSKSLLHFLKRQHTRSRKERKQRNSSENGLEDQVKELLLPLHRIDQPCSGVLLYAKTKTVAAAISAAWKEGLVTKHYHTIVSCRSLKRIEDMSQTTSVNKDDVDLMGDGLGNAAKGEDSGGAWRTLRGHLLHLPPSAAKMGRPSIMIPAEIEGSETLSVPDSAIQRRDCEIQWNIAWNHQDFACLHVKTSQGSRHLIRSMMAMVSAPLEGDVKYGASFPLPDQSVALHATSVQLPTSLGSSSIDVLGFDAPLPETWSDFFGMTLEHRQSMLETVGDRNKREDHR